MYRWFLMGWLLTSLAWAQGPPNPWVRPNCLLGHQPAFAVHDLLDTAIDSSLWTVQATTNTAWTDALITVTETAGELRITPRTGVSALSYNGYRSASTHDLTNGLVAAEIKQVAGTVTGLNTVLVLALDANNNYNIAHDNTELKFQVRIGGTLTTSGSVIYQATPHRWWQIRHVSEDNSIRFETSTDGVTWTERHRIASAWSVTAVRAGVEGGTWQSVGTTGTAILDNLRIVSTVTGYRWYVHLSPGITPNGTDYVRQTLPSVTSVRCPDLGLVVGQTRYVLVTSVGPLGESLPSNEIELIISEGTIGVQP